MIKNRNWVIVKGGLIIGTILLPILIFWIGWKTWWSPLLGFLCGAVVSYIFVEINTTYVQAKSFVERDGKCRTVFSEGTWAWKSWLENYALEKIAWVNHGYLLSYSQQSVHLELPTSDGILCHLIILRLESPESVLSLNKILKTSEKKWVSFDQLARYISFEFIHFCKDNWGESVQLFNPLEPEQQTAFQQKFIAFLEKFQDDLGITGDHLFLGVGVGTHFELTSQPKQWAKAG